MQLSDYLAAQGETVTAFAARIDRSPSTVSRLMRGLTDPNGETLRRVREATDGAVQPNDFFDGAEAPEPKMKAVV